MSCHICRITCLSKSSLVKHYYESHKAEYLCPYCAYQFDSEEDRKTHVEKNHVSQAKFTCVICGFSSRNKKDLSSHQRESHQNAGQLTCGKCKILAADADCLRIHQMYCSSEQNNVEAPKVNTDDNTTRQRSHGGRSYNCEYCSQSFRNRHDYGLHSIENHGAGVLCSYCDRHLTAPPNDKTAAMRVFNEHLQRDHKEAQMWICIYCHESFKDRQELYDHQASVNHILIKCHVCLALMPSKALRAWHFRYQHQFFGDKDKNKPPGQDQFSREKGLCLCCFKRIPMAELFDHLCRHSNQARTIISCNEHFAFITADTIGQHMRCFDSEAIRFKSATEAPDSGTSSYLSCGQCGFCALSGGHLSRHYGWCHKEISCQSCGGKEYGHVGISKHICPNGGNVQFPPQIPPNSGGYHSSSESDFRGCHSISTIPKNAQARQSPRQVPRRSISLSLNEDESTSAAPVTPVVVVTNNESQLELPIPDSPESDHATANSGEMDPPLNESVPSIKREETVTSNANNQMAPRQRTDSNSNQTALCRRKDSSSSSVKAVGSVVTIKLEDTSTSKVTNQIPARQRKDSSSSTSSSDSSDEDQQKKSTATTSTTTAMKRLLPQLSTTVTSKRSRRDSSTSSSSSSSSDDDQPPIAQPPIAQLRTKVLAKKPAVTPRRDSSSSSSSSDDDEPVEKVQSTVKKPKATSTASKSVETASSKKTIGTTPKPPAPAKKKNVFATSTPAQNDTPVSDSGRSRKRRSANVVVEFACTLCKMTSVYIQNVQRHVVNTHRILADMADQFCQARERPKTPEEVDDPEQQPEMRSIGIQAAKPCNQCKEWKKKAEALQKFVAGLDKQLKKLGRNEENGDQLW